MREKRNISWRKLIRALFGLSMVVMAYLAMTSSARVYQQRPLQGMEVAISNPWIGFVAPEFIEEQLLDRRGLMLDRLKAHEVDLNQMERVLRSNPWIQSAEVHMDPQHVIQVTLTQRRPLLRVWDQEGNSLYLDAHGQQMPLSNRYTHYGLMITHTGSLDHLDRLDWEAMVTLAQWIEADTFWNAQTSQLIYNSEGEFELIPLLGTQRILLGKAENLEEKFSKLLLFYDQVLADIGWDQYEVLDLRFKGQVVAAPQIKFLAQASQKPAQKIQLGGSIPPADEVEGLPSSEGPLDPLPMRDPIQERDGQPVPSESPAPREPLPPTKPPDPIIDQPDRNQKEEEQKPKYIYRPEGQ